MSTDKKIEKEIAKLEKQARTEKQPKKKFELVQRVKALKKLIKELNGSGVIFIRAYKNGKIFNLDCDNFIIDSNSFELLFCHWQNGILDECLSWVVQVPH